MSEKEKPKREPRNVIPPRTPQTNGTHIGARNVDRENITEVIQEQFKPEIDNAEYGPAPSLDKDDDDDNGGQS